MVLVNAVGGCESYNLHHLLEQGSARTGETPQELAKVCMELCRSEAVFPTVQKNAAPIIYETMKKEYEAHEKSEKLSSCPQC